MEWNTVLGLSASLLAGRVTRVPPNYPLVRSICPSLEHQDPEALSGALRRQNFPSTGGGAMPALGAMQEPIPDYLAGFYSKQGEKTLFTGNPENQTMCVYGQ